MEVFTSDLRAAGTDCEVFVVLHGEKGDTEQEVLGSQPYSFQRGSCDKFK